MDARWISTTTALPAKGQPVQFMLYRRQSPIAGVYAPDGFRSRWTRYAPELVSKWRGLTEDVPLESRVVDGSFEARFPSQRL